MRSVVWVQAQGSGLPRLVGLCRYAEPVVEFVALVHVYTIPAAAEKVCLWFVNRFHPLFLLLCNNDTSIALYYDIVLAENKRSPVGDLFEGRD